jgi:hypothetical protein
MDKIIKIGLLSVIVSLIIFISSCTKKSDETSNNQDGIETEIISDTNFTENDEELLTVDYKEFYEQLAPHGKWIQVTDDEVGVDLTGISASNKSPDGKISLSELLGVNTAYADVDIGMFFIWQPSPNLAVGMTIGNAVTAMGANTYVPYSNGQWIYTTNGWYFRAPTHYEEITSHYGRWFFSPALGWVWVPGRLWAPAWVDWYEDDNYIAWAPLPPSVYIVNNICMPPVIVEHHYMIVERTYFVEPGIYKYMYKGNRHKFKIKDMRRRDGIFVYNNMVINNGPDINLIRTATNRNIETVKLEKVRDIGNIKYKNDKYSVYSPHFEKVKGKPNQNITYSKPEKFVNSKDIKSEKKNDYYVEKKNNIGKNNTDIPKKFNEKGNKDNNSVNSKEKKDIGIEKKKENKNNNQQKQDKGNNQQKQDNNTYKQKQDKGNNQQKQDNSTYKQKQDKGSNRQKQDNSNYKQKQDKGNNQQKQDKGNNQQKQDKGNFKQKQDNSTSKQKQDKGNVKPKQNKQVKQEKVINQKKQDKSKVQQKQNKVDSKQNQSKRNGKNR